jgi:hypothetical protein
MKNYKSKFKKNSHVLLRMNTDIKKYFIVLNKIKFGMGGWVIRVHQWPINLGWGRVIQRKKICVYLRAFFAKKLAYSVWNKWFF